MRDSNDPNSCLNVDAATHGLGRGHLAVICGCMFSGKTTELLRRLAGCRPASALVFKHIIDNRYREDAIVSHGGKAYPATAIAHAHHIIDRIHEDMEIVAVDEAHFFDLSLVEVCRKMSALGKSVIITSLDRDSWGRPFPVAERLRSIANEPIVKRAICARCGAPADRTQRITPIINGDMVGGPESYEPRCKACWKPPPELPPA